MKRSRKPSRPKGKPPAQPSKPPAGSEFASYDAAVQYLYSRINYEKTAEKTYTFRLHRMHELIERLQLNGIAGRDVPLVHVAGTKGKGSTSTLVAAMLSQSGFRTGLYTSPHLSRIEERFRVDGSMPSETEMVALVEQVAHQAERMQRGPHGAPTFFEMTTTMALLHFRNRGCNAVVLEVGLGGRLDSTNVCFPTVTAITSIGLDHQHVLGKTLSQIATQKAGIIKSHVPIVCGAIPSLPMQAITQIAEQHVAPLYRLGKEFEARVRSKSSTDDWQTSFDLISHDPSIRSRNDWLVPLDGEHQAANACIACAIMDQLAALRVDTSLEDQRAGMAAAKLQGRVERFRLSEQVDLILDTSHNVDSIQALCKCIEQRRGGRPVTIVFGTSRDKDHHTILSLLCDHADYLVLSRYHNNPRYREIDELQASLPMEHLRMSAGKITIIHREQPLQAIDWAIQRTSEPQLIVVCGSFFLAAEVRPSLTSGFNQSQFSP